jgi:protein-S-isoprenylcysteine O-methyltransferase Ste14
MRWSNVPIPEPHVAALLGGPALHWLQPVRLPIGRGVAWVLGAPLVAGGIGLAAWAVASAGDTDVERDADLVTEGAYAMSRNPMYVGWSAGVLGLALVTRSAWLVGAWIVAVAALDREVEAEERRLGATFGSAYDTYRARVPRYVAFGNR